MKAYLAGILLTLAGGSFAYGQNFTFTADTTWKPGQPGETVYFHADLHNLESFPDSFRVRYLTDVPSGWTVTFCLSGLGCFPPWVQEADILVQANHVDTVYLDVTVEGSGSEGWLTAIAYPLGYPEMADSIAFYVHPYNAVESHHQPAAYSLLAAYPNPFNGAVNLAFDLKKSGAADLAVFDPQGRCVVQVFQGRVESGVHQFSWQPEGLASGPYLVRLNFDGTQKLQKIAYLR